MGWDYCGFLAVAFLGLKWPEEPTLINTPISGAQTGSELRYKAVSTLQVEETLSLANHVPSAISL